MSLNTVEQNAAGTGLQPKRRPGRRSDNLAGASTPVGTNATVGRTGAFVYRGMDVSDLPISLTVHSLFLAEKGRVRCLKSR